MRLDLSLIQRERLEPRIWEYPNSKVWGGCSPWMNYHPLVFASFYGLTVALFAAGFRCPYQRLLTGIPANRELCGRLVALQSRVQFIRIDCQRLRKARMTGLSVQVNQSQYPPVGGKRDAFQKLLIRFYAIGARWQHLIEPAKDEGSPEGHCLLARAYRHWMTPDWRPYRPIQGWRRRTKPPPFRLLRPGPGRGRNFGRSLAGLSCRPIGYRRVIGFGVGLFFGRSIVRGGKFLKGHAISLSLLQQ